MASSEDRARLPRGLPETIRTRSWLFIRLYLFSDLLTNCGQRGAGGGRGTRARETPVQIRAPPRAPGSVTPPLSTGDT